MANASGWAFRQVGADLGPVHGRVEDVARLASRAGHEHRVDAGVVVLGHGAGALGRFVVGVGMDGEEAESLVGHGETLAAVSAAYAG